MTEPTVTAPRAERRSRSAPFDAAFFAAELDPALWQGDYENDPAFRETVQNWVNQLWIEKDRRIKALRAEG